MNKEAMIPKTIIPKPKKLFFISLILAFLLFASPVRAWLDCPYGRINDPYPGQCDLYTDTNNNQICDHSEAPPKETQPLFCLILQKTPVHFLLFWE
jgi:hypothetical protein